MLGLRGYFKGAWKALSDARYCFVCIEAPANPRLPDPNPDRCRWGPGLEVDEVHSKSSGIGTSTGRSRSINNSAAVGAVAGIVVVGVGKIDRRRQGGRSCSLCRRISSRRHRHSSSSTSRGGGSSSNSSGRGSSINSGSSGNRSGIFDFVINHDYYYYYEYCY